MRGDRPKLYTHDAFKVYSALKQCMQNQEEMRVALLDAAKTIEKLTKMLEEKNKDES